MEYKVSAIIVYNNEEQLQQAKRYLEGQSVAVEQVFLDNRGRRFSCAAEALNYGASRAAGEYLVFLHQDLYLWDSRGLQTYCEFLSAHPDAIAGPAGVHARHGVVTDLYLKEGQPVPGTPAQGKQLTVDALDECLLAMKRQTWEDLGFDSVCCDDWHGYGMDICFANRLRGGQNVMLPLYACHGSQGNPHTRAFRRAMSRLVEKYRRTSLGMLRGCCISIPCRRSALWWYCLKEELKDAVRRLRRKVS